MSGGYNLERGSSCGLSQPGDRSYTAPLLGPLQQNGGPTPTHALLPGSPAIDGGDLAGCKDGTGAALSADQRGQPRPVDGDGNGGAICDIGAVESGTGGPVPSGMMTDDTAAGLTYDGWGGARDAAASGSGYRVAGAAGETIRYRAARMSQSVTLLTFRGPSQGKARVTIDGVSSTTVDLYSPRPVYQVPLTFSGLALRRHTVEVKALGEMNTASAGTRVRVDGFQVRGVTVEESSPQVRYGNWMGRSDTRAHGGSYRYSATPGATLSFRFSGSRFRWVTTRGPSHGWAQVIVDGKVIMTVDLYSPVVQWQFAQEIGGLTRGTHAVQIKVLGAHSRGSRGNTVVFDGFSVP
ncbi:MAG TPA: choice-of-anchor Q domain-containing protein [Ardenticatenaceae bacterium]|nr:choice-of-anchor Q domain-containing protein [Ardenticatenaceae bacterium]